MTSYSYDAAHRLIGEAGPGGAKASFVLDAAGNLLDKPGLTRAQLLEGNRLARAEGERFTYDARNHLAERITDAGEATRYRYNSLDMLVEIAWSSREARWTAGYDGLRRRLYKSLGQERTEYFWDGDRLAAEIGPTGALRIYVYPGPGALVPFLFIEYASIDAAPESGKAYYVFGNQIGAPLHIEDQRGVVVSARRARRAPRADHRRQGRFHRVLAALPRAFPRRGDRPLLQPQPVLQPAPGPLSPVRSHRAVGGINLYAYTANPLTQVDILGLMCADNNSSDKMDIDQENNDGRKSPNAMDVEEPAPTPPRRVIDLQQQAVDTTYLTEGKGKANTGEMGENVVIFWNPNKVNVSDIQATKVPGQPTEREAVLFTVTPKSDPSKQYKFVTMHAPFHDNDGAAAQYMNDIYKAVKNQTKPFDNVDVIMGDSNTYGGSISSRALPGFKVADISATTHGKGKSRLDKLIYKENNFEGEPPMGKSDKDQTPNDDVIRVVGWNGRSNNAIRPETIGATAYERGWDVISLTEPRRDARGPQGVVGRATLSSQEGGRERQKLLQSDGIESKEELSDQAPQAGEEHSDHKPIFVDLPAGRPAPAPSGPTRLPTFEAPASWTPHQQVPQNIANSGVIRGQPIVINGQDFQVARVDASGNVWVTPDEGRMTGSRRGARASRHLS